jgi:hypothetical protein
LNLSCLFANVRDVAAVHECHGVFRVKQRVLTALEHFPTQDRVGRNNSGRTNQGAMSARSLFVASGGLAGESLAISLA